MLIHRFLPVYAPEGEAGLETGTDSGAVGGAPPAGGAAEATEAEPEPQEQLPDGPGSGRGKLRKQLESANAESKKADAGRDKKGQYQSRARTEQDGQEPAEGTEAEVKPGEQKPVVQQQVAAPEAFSKEAKAEWAKVPAPVQAAILKREQDVAVGVNNLRRNYTEIDAALQPFLGAIQEHKTTPGKAINQLFSWMGALTTEAQGIKAGKPPSGAFAALAKSYGIDPVRLLAHMVQNPQQIAGTHQTSDVQHGQQQPGQIDPNIKAYLDHMLGGVNQQVGNLSQTLEQQGLAKSAEMLSMWSKDKPFYEDVRVTMAHFLTPNAQGTAIVPPLANGNADLDKAYDMAVYAMPEVRAKVAAAQQAAEAKTKADAAAAEKKAQQGKLEAARKASGSIPISAPGAPAIGKDNKRKGSKSVRESIEEATRQVNERING